MNAAAPQKDMGSVNGASQALASFVRAVGPALGGVLWGLSVIMPLPGHQAHCLSTPFCSVVMFETGNPVQATGTPNSVLKLLVAAIESLLLGCDWFPIMFRGFSACAKAQVLPFALAAAGFLAPLIIYRYVELPALRDMGRKGSANLAH